MNYNQLNEILKKELNNPDRKTHIKNLDEFSKYAKIIIDYPDDFEYEPYTIKIDLNKSIQLVSSFLKSISPQYENQFQNVIREQQYYNCPSYEFKKSNTPISTVYSDGHVLIGYQENLEDAFNILHESIHKFSQPYKENNIIKDFYGEITPITMEFLFQEYLIKNNLFESENKIYCRKRIRSTYFDAASVLFEYHLLNLYQVNRNISESVIEEYIESLPHESTEHTIFKNHYKEYLQDILNKNHLNFPIRQRYVLGTIFSIYFKNGIEKDSSFVKYIDQLIRIFGDSNSKNNKNIRELVKCKNPIVNLDGYMDSLLKQSYIAELENLKFKKEKSLH